MGTIGNTGEQGRAGEYQGNVLPIHGRTIPWYSPVYLAIPCFPLMLGCSKASQTVTQAQTLVAGDVESKANSVHQAEATAQVADRLIQRTQERANNIDQPTGDGAQP